MLMGQRFGRRLAVPVTCAFLALWASSARSEDLWPDLSKPAQAVGSGEKDAAVVVGAENYAFVAKVPGARRNAEDWQAYLTDTLKVPSDRVALLRDNEATLEKMRQLAAQAAAQAEKGGTLWFVFIGQGAPSHDGKDGLLVGADAQRDPGGLYARSLPRNELLRLLSKGKQAKTVVLIDASFSGRTPSDGALAAGLQLLMAGRPQGADRRTVLLMAAKSDQFAGPLPKASRMRPAFSYLALGALRGWAADAHGKVTASAVVKFARRSLALDEGNTQTPELAAGAAGAVLGRGHEPAPDLGKIALWGIQFPNLQAVPAVEAPRAFDPAAAGGLDLRNLDAAALEEYHAAFEFDKSNDAEPSDKAQSWHQLAKDVPKCADMAGKRAAEWDLYVGRKRAADMAKQKRIEARDADWEKLKHLLALRVIPEADKAFWSGEFLIAYWKSPGIEPSMAKGLAAHIADEDMREALEKLARKASSAAIPEQATAGKAGIEWVRIPGGSFMMGSDDWPDAKPRHEVALKTFQMAKTLVTNKQYQACVWEGACTPPENYGDNFNGDNQPVVGVDWNQAKAFSEWVGGRLPSEAEWEYAARSAGKDWKHPWGNEDAACGRAVILGCGSATAPVCSKPAGNTRQGLCDMAGNAWEWTQDWYHGSYHGAPTDGGAWENPAGALRVNRGGSWFNGADFARSANRFNTDPGNRLKVFVGFRPAR